MMLSSRGSRLCMAVGVGVGFALSGCDKPKPVARELPRIAQPSGSNTNKRDATPTLGLPPLPTGISTDPHLPQPSELFNAFYKFVNDKGRVAKNVEELVATGYLTPLPPPPPGKKYLLNNQSLDLRVVDIK